MTRTATPLPAFATLAILGLAATPAAAQYQFRNIDQPGLNAPTFFPTGINKAGVIVGGYTDTAGNLFGFEYDHGIYAQFNYLGTNNSELDAINNSGVIAADYTDSSGLRHGLVLASGINGPATQFDYPGAVATAPNGINDQGDLVGQYSTVGNAYNDPWSGFTRINGAYQSFSEPGYAETYGLGNNNAGEVVGYAVNYKKSGGISQAQAFTDSNGVLTPISIPGAVDTQAFDINNKGTIIGGYRTQHSGGFTGFVLNGGAVTTFSYPGAQSTYLSQLNDNGDLVGYYDVNHNVHGFVAYAAPTVLTYTSSSGAALRSGAFSGHTGFLRFEFNPSVGAGAATVTLSHLKFQGNWSFNGAAATFSSGVTYTGSLSDPTTLSFSIPNIGATNFFQLPVSTFGDGFTYDLAENGALTGAPSDFIATAIDDPLVLQDMRFTPGNNTATLVSEASGASVTATGDTPAPAPEPSQLAALGLGALGLIGLKLKARKR